MAAIKLRGDTYHAIWYDQYGNKKFKSTKIKVSIFGHRKAKQLAERKASEFEIAAKSKGAIQTDFESVRRSIETLANSDKIKLAVILSSHLPDNYSTTISQADVTITYPELREEWLSVVRHEKSDNWLSKEKTNNNLMISFLESINISSVVEITTKHINQFISSQADRGKAPNTINDYLKHIKQCFDQAVAYEYIKENPVAKANKPQAKVLKEFVEIPVDVCKQLINRDEIKTDDYIYWSFLRYTGLAPIDVTSLTPDVIKNDKGGSYIDGKRTKTQVANRIPLHSKLSKIIDEFGSRCFGIYSTKGQRDASSRRFKSRIKKITNGKIVTTVYSLRHTFSTALFNAGHSVDDIKLITGHTNGKMLTKTYIKEEDQEIYHEDIVVIA